MGCSSSKDTSPAFDSPAATAAPVMAQLVSTPSTHGVPARVRALFRKMDADGDGMLTLEEITAGFDKEFGSDMPTHAKEKVKELFEAHAKPDASGTPHLKSGAFSRFYAEILFRKFDLNNNGTLQLDEAQEALRFLKKSAEDGNRPAVIAAFPDDAYDKDTGELQLKFRWFWSLYVAME